MLLLGVLIGFMCAVMGIAATSLEHDETIYWEGYERGKNDAERFKRTESAEPEDSDD